MFDLIERSAGREEVVMTDTRAKVNNRLKLLRSSRRGDRVEFFIRPAADAAKFKKRHRHRSH